MAKRETKCWEPLGWVRGERIGEEKEGFQSMTSYIRRTSDLEDEYGYILKVLRRQDVDDRRAMFCAETRAMSVLDHPGVLAIEDTNAENYKESVELFLITRRALGTDLDDFVACGIGFDDALRVVLGVLDILRHCHGRGVIHRDIKPCHVIIEPGRFESPIVIDFGLAYIEDGQPSGATTEDGQRKGNRFLIGPEHSPGSSLSTRNTTTDICQCVGLLFFTVTGTYPAILLDEQERKPHQRPGVQIDTSIDEWKREALNVVFDKAFEWHPDNRWNDVETLSKQLQQMLQQTLSPDEALKLKATQVIRESAIAARVDTLERAREMSRELFGLVDRVLASLEDTMKEYVAFEATEQGLDFSFPSSEPGAAQKTISFRPRHGRTWGLAISVRTMLDGTSITATLQPYSGASVIFPDNQPVELGRSRVGDTEFLNKLRAPLEEKLLAAVDELLRGGPDRQPPEIVS